MKCECERGEVLHPGSCLFIELIAGAGAPSTTVTSRCQKAAASICWEGCGRNQVRPQPGGPHSVSHFGSALQRLLQGSSRLLMGLVRKLALDFDFPQIYSKLFIFQK